MLPESVLIKGYRSFCVSIIELQINHQTSFEEKVQQWKTTKNVNKTLHMTER